jgi:predicted NAD/FAD-binding protein
MNLHLPPQTIAKDSGRLKIAVVGSGISGASAAWALRDVHDVTLYEAEKRPGGHTATVDIDYDGTPLSVDTGFIVYNELNYPNLTALFAHLDVKTHDSDMSFALSLDHGKLEWGGDNLKTLFAQKRNLLRPSFLLMLREVLRFNKICLQDRAAGHLAARSIGDYLNWRGFSPGFMNNYLVPMAAAIWSTPAKRMMEFPATYFVNFFENHRLIYSERPIWRTVTGGSRNYLVKLLEPLGERVRLDAGVVSVRRSAEGVDILDATGRLESYDRVILACHTDQALSILDRPTEDERAILSAIPYSANRVILHRDERLDADPQEGLGVVELPALLRSAQRRQCRGVLLDEPAAGHRRRTSRCSSRSTPTGSRGRSWFSASSAMTTRSSVQRCHGCPGPAEGRSRVTTTPCFAGAWTGYGFHEDGLSSGIAGRPEALGAVLPWHKDPARVPEVADA